jgi:hypothetical protein
MSELGWKYEVFVGRSNNGKEVKVMERVYPSGMRERTHVWEWYPCTIPLPLQTQIWIRSKLAGREDPTIAEWLDSFN